MHENEGYYYWGMHMGWWVFVIVIAIIFIGFLFNTRRRK